jgi:fucose permease
VLALVAFGAANAVLGVAINAHAATVERRYLAGGGPPIMASFHALFSGGGLVGSAVGGALAARGVPPAWHLAGVAAAALGAAVWVPRAMLPAAADARPADAGPGAAGAPAAARRRTRPSAALAALGVVAFCVLLAEGAMADWSAVYLRTVVGAGPGAAAAGYAAFSVMMALGRAAGDGLTARLGPAAVVRAGGALAALGLVAAVLAPHAALVVAGFGAVGAGLATVFPSVLAAASRLPDAEPAAGIAATSAAGYTGFLAGPPLIGIVAEAVSLRGGLGVVAGAALVIVGLSSTLRGPATVSPRP